MNKITAVVRDIIQNDVVTYVEIESGKTPIRLIKTKLPEWLRTGDTVYCIFQEASVCVSKECPGKVSIENRIPGTLVGIRKSESLCELTFDSSIGQVVSLITEQAHDELELEEGCEATMLIRGVDLQLEPTLDILREYTTRIKDAN